LLAALALTVLSNHSRRGWFRPKNRTAVCSKWNKTQGRPHVFQLDQHRNIIIRSSLARTSLRVQMAPRICPKVRTVHCLVDLGFFKEPLVLKCRGFYSEKVAESNNWFGTCERHVLSETGMKGMFCLTR
jgi:hypothetical protein